MKLNVKKLELRDLRDVERLIMENVESLESDLEIIDSCVLLGHARVDLIGLDANGALVLIALGFAGNDEMLLRMLDAYSWCLDYPDTIRRLYPRTRIQPGRSPRVRVVFVAESLPDAFVRKVKHFSFPEVHCLKFLYFEINGEPAAYFDTVERIRRVPVNESPAQEPTLGDGVEMPETLPVQHEFIEGTPPMPRSAPSNGNGAHGAREAEPRPASWQAFLKELGTSTEPETSETPATPLSQAPTGESRGNGSTAPPVDWQGFPSQVKNKPSFEADSEASARRPPAAESMLIDAAGQQGGPAHADPERRDAPPTSDPGDDGMLSREWRDFLNQLKVSE